MRAPPHRILLATDLSARSDRAQDRAVSLMEQYDAGLVVLHVLEPTKRNRKAHCVRFTATFKPDETLIEKTQQKVLGYLKDVAPRAMVRIEKGDPRRAILRIAEEEKCDLVVTGVARNEMLGRVRLGKTVEGLLSHSPIPLLIVNERVTAPYLNIVVSSDFSDISRQAIETVAAYFPDRILTVLHAHSTPGAWAAADMEAYRDQMRKTAYKEFTDFLNAGLSGSSLDRFNVLVEWGDLAQLLRDLVQIQAVDLVVVGSNLRGFLHRAFKTGTAKRVVSAVPCDALVIPGRPS